MLPPFHSWPFASAHQATPSHDTPADHPCPPTPLAPSDRAEPQKPRYSKHTASSHRRVTLAAQDRPQSASPTGNSRPSFSLADARPSTAPTAQQDDMDITLSKGMGPAPRDADCQHDDDSPPGVSHRMSQRAQSELGAGPSNQSLSRSGMRMPGTQERLEAAMRQQLAYPVEQVPALPTWLFHMLLLACRMIGRLQGGQLHAVLSSGVATWCAACRLLLSFVWTSGILAGCYASVCAPALPSREVEPDPCAAVGHCGGIKLAGVHRAVPIPQSLQAAVHRRCHSCGAD